MPLSSRWTIPGRSGSPPPPRISPSSSTRVGPLCEAPGGRPARPACRRPPARRRGGRSRSSGSATLGLALGVAQVDRGRAATTPTVIATSARLKGGQGGRSMKSVTAPARTRSARLPRAPPASSPAATHIPGRAGLRAEEVARSARGRPGVTSDQPGAAAAGEAEGDAACCGTRVELQRAEDLDLLAGHEMRLDRPPCGLVERRRPGRRARRPGARRGPPARSPSIRPTTIACDDEEHDDRRASG